MAMQKSRYKKHGFKGLTTTGKLFFILAFITAGASVWFFSVKPDFAESDVQPENFPSYILSYVWAIIKVMGVGLIAAYLVHFFLPKVKFPKHEFYCADCGEFLGYSIERCPRIECCSNRYTTDAELAKRQAFKWQKKHSQQ